MPFDKILNDPKISFKAKGIFVSLSSMQDGFNTSIQEISKYSCDGKTSIRAGIYELEEYGYIKRIQLRGDDGRIQGWKCILNNSPNQG